MRILAIRVGRVGDTVMMTPALSALLQCYPDADFTLLASPEGKNLLKDFHPRIKEIWSWNRHGIIQNYLDQKEIRRRTRLANFDKIFCFDTSKRIAGLFRDIPAEFHWFKGSNTLKHSARHYLELVAATCPCDIDHFYNYLPVSDTAAQQVNAELKCYGISQQDTLVMIHPTFSGYSRLGLRKRQARIRKLWPAQYYGQLGKQLAQTTLADGTTPKVFMAILPAELHYARKIAAASEGSILLLESQPTFERYKALIARANVMLSPDSGPMHIASALGTRIVAFFSMKEPADCGPYMPKDLFTILRSDDPVKGISTINVDTVFDAVKTQLNASLKQ
jgi:heptosyltransferase I